MSDDDVLMRKRRKAAAVAAAISRSSPDPSSKPYSPYSFTANLPKYIFYAACALFVFLIGAYYYNFNFHGVVTYDITSDTYTRIPISAEMNIPLQYTSTPIPSTVSTTFPSPVLQTGYTVAFDVNIADATPVQDNYRVIFYNGAQSRDPSIAASDPSQTNNRGNALSFTVPYNGSAAVNGTSLESIQTALFSNSTNLCMYMAPDTNDVYLTYYIGHFTPGKIDSSGSTGPTEESLNGWGVSKPIKNVPIGKPFRVTLIVDEQFIETYINGQLVLVTKTYIPGQTSNLHSYSSSNNYNFYGSPDVMYLKGIRVANFQYIGQVIPSKSVRVYCSKPSTTVNYSQ